MKNYSMFQSGARLGRRYFRVAGPAAVVRPGDAASDQPSQFVGRQAVPWTALFCNTQQQIERYVAAFDGDDEAAINAVNAEAHDPNACGYRPIAYIRGPEVAITRNRTWTFNIVEVLVVAVLTEAGFEPVAAEAFFSVEQVDERVAFISPYGF